MRGSRAILINILKGWLSDVHIYEGKSLADNVPIALFKSVFPAKRFPDLPEKLMVNQSVTTSLKDSGIADYTRLSTEISAVLPS